MSKAFASQADLEEKTVSFTKLSDHAYAYTAEGDPNSGIVIGDDAVMVIDTQATPAMAQDVIRRIREVTDKPIKYVVLSHYHAVRVLGASAYKPEHIIASDDTLSLIRERGEQDKATETELINDPKERAEHVMLIDLARNDIGRIARIGSVKVTEAFTVERYSHVMHIVSNVEGLLLDGMSSLDVLKATFPAGTLTGTTLAANVVSPANALVIELLAGAPAGLPRGDQSGQGLRPEPDGRGAAQEEHFWIARSAARLAVGVTRSGTDRLGGRRRAR